MSNSVTEISKIGASEDEKRYHHGDLREALLQAALRHIEAAGTEKLSLRALARELGVSPTALYRHVPNRTGLLAALATSGFVELRQRTEEAIAQHGDDHQAALLAGGEAYITYAVENPVKYHLMFGSVLGSFDEFPEMAEAADASFEEVVAMLRLGQQAGVFVDTPLPDLAATVWASVHGIASLLINKEPLDAAAGEKGGPRMARAALASLRNDVTGVLERMSFTGILRRGGAD